MIKQTKQLIRVDTLTSSDFVWNDEVHQLMHDDSYRLINISTTTDIATGKVNHYAWFEYQMKTKVGLFGVW